MQAPTVKASQKKNRHPKPTHMQGEASIATGDFLGLQGLQTTAQPEVGDYSIIVKAMQLVPASCPYCDCATKQFHSSNGTRQKQQCLLDEPRGFRRVRIELTRRNFRCEACGTYGLLPLWGVKERQRLTDRLVHHVELVSLLRPHAEVALMTGLSGRKVREVFDAHVRQLEKTVEFELPRVIGLDGITIRKKGRFVVITDVERKLVLHVWNYSRASAKDDPQAATRALVAMLRKMDGAGQIETVIIDMSLQFRSAIEQALPQATIVIDRFHIQRTANEAMDNVRKRLHKKLKTQESKAKMCHAAMLRKRWLSLEEHQSDYLKEWFRQYPVLGTAYHAKEGFCLMWDAGSAADARKYYEEWSRQFATTVCETEEQTQMREDFSVILSPMKDWGKHIYSYFDLDLKHTNAFTEWANRRIRDLRRESRGCGVEVIRAKLIFGTWLKKQLKEGSEKWGEKMVMGKRTRRPSVAAPKTGDDAKELQQTPMPALRRRILPGQLSLFEL
jgi:transposase